MVAVSGASLVDDHPENRTRSQTIHVYEPLDQAGRGKLQSGGMPWLAVPQGLTDIPSYLDLRSGSLGVSMLTRQYLMGSRPVEIFRFAAWVRSEIFTYPGRKRYHVNVEV